MVLIDTPCVGVCSTVYGDGVCRGCKRHFDEVIDWNRFDEPQKTAIYARLDEQADKIVSQFLTIKDPNKLSAALDQYSIRYRPQHHPATWVLYWLRFSRQEIPWEQLGLALLPEYQAYTRVALFTAVDDALYKHACIHFDGL